MEIKPLTIGELTAEIPVIQGGMGIGISLSSLAGAVAGAGGIGVISAAQPGYQEPDFEENTLEANLRALDYHIRRAKELSGGGIIGVNIMCAMNHYEEFVRQSVQSGADLIISGAGLPADLPALTAGSNIKIAPIVSPVKSARVLLRRWDQKYGRAADLVIIEGPEAGGHLGYSAEELRRGFPGYDREITEILQIVKGYEEKYQRAIPVVFGGGVYDRKDMEHYLSLGCAGVQMATRFVTTRECDAPERYKEAYLAAQKEDIVLVESPVGMPGRAIRNQFIREREKGREAVSVCYRCLRKCNPRETPYCITGALIRAARGETEEALLFCGSNAWRAERIETVKEIMEELSGRSR